MLWMGEEYGEQAPFQFFTDHIDEEIATATREGRRREFATFARFAGEEVPDPQDPETFVRSELTREGDDALRELYGALLRARRQLPRGPVDAVDHDEQARWVRVRRGDYTLYMNFADVQQVLPADPSSRLVVATDDAASIGPDGVRLPPLAGVLAEAGR
jgi:maltooligosyltrehalose trehalohydrolase